MSFMVSPHIQDAMLPHTAQTVILPLTINACELQATAAWLNKNPHTKVRPKPRLMRRLRIDPPS
jgi:hypothetical protein